MEKKLIIPPYVGGKADEKEYQTGSGMIPDGKGNTPGNGKMQIIRETSASEFLAFSRRMEEAGWLTDFAKEDENGIYRLFCPENYRPGDETVYAYHHKRIGVTNVVRETCSCPLSAFETEGGKEKFDTTDLMQYGLYYSRMTPGTSADCGMLYVLRQRDGSLILVDGGEREQATEASVAEFIFRVRDLIGTPEGEPIRVAAWFCTHPHDDHMDYFLKLVKQHGDIFKVERLMFNFGAASGVFKDDYVDIYRKALGEWLPDALFLNLHTGEEFSLGNVRVKVIQTHEDIAKRGGEPMWPNTASTIIQFFFEDRSFLLLGDADEGNGEEMLRVYGEHAFRCTFLQSAHHCINRVENIYANVDADVVLIPQGRFSVHSRFRENYNCMRQYYIEDNMILAGDYTAIFRCGKDEMPMYMEPVVGGCYDGSWIF